MMMMMIEIDDMHTRVSVKPEWLVSETKQGLSVSVYDKNYNVSIVTFLKSVTMGLKKAHTT